MMKAAVRHLHMEWGLLLWKNRPGSQMYMCGLRLQSSVAELFAPDEQEKN